MAAHSVNVWLVSTSGKLHVIRSLTHILRRLRPQAACICSCAYFLPGKRILHCVQPFLCHQCCHMRAIPLPQFTGSPNRRIWRTTWENRRWRLHLTQSWQGFVGTFPPSLLPPDPGLLLAAPTGHQDGQCLGSALPSSCQERHSHPLVNTVSGTCDKIVNVHARCSVTPFKWKTFPVKGSGMLSLVSTFS